MKTTGKKPYFIVIQQVVFASFRKRINKNKTIQKKNRNVH